MKKHILILRQESSEAERYWEKYYYKTEDRGATVATALGSLTWDQLEEKDKTPSASYRPVAWDHSCLQKKCGACAMVIDGIPRLACKTRLAECGETIKVEPLKKFPLVEDLIVDRSAMMDQLKKLSVWFDEEAGTRGEKMAYEASRCLQCGLCLEVCPNFYAGGSFAGMAGMAPLARLLAKMPDNQRKKTASAYRKAVFEGCGKSLACRDICPAGIDIERLLVKSNAAALWRRWKSTDRWPE